MRHNGELMYALCGDCQCLPDYCQKIIPQSACPCGDGQQVPCKTGTQQLIGAGTTAVGGGFSYVLPYGVTGQQLIMQQGQLPSQFIVQGQQQQQQQLQFVQTVGGLQQPQLVSQLVPQQPQLIAQLVPQQPRLSPVFILRTIEQGGRVIQQVPQVPQPMLPAQYTSQIQRIPLQQSLLLVPSVSQLLTQQQQQQLTIPMQTPAQAVTLQVPGNSLFNLQIDLQTKFEIIGVG
ncbi:unnamed protein product [Gongylonema pulchrum]|uniref:VWFC domain-containing protein n=1 Tax=Gongylonema pulchrum TaxID=637853 RepID=A0A183CWE7_9BILA|nr:unnamed protein product [Gongylonema pulchrum]